MRRILLAALLGLALVACDDDGKGKGKNDRGAISPVPEPTAALLFAAGAGVLAWRMRR